MQIVRNKEYSADCNRYLPKEVIIEEGDSSNIIYILIRGQLGVYRNGTRIATIKEAGTIFGEMSSILGKQRTCTVSADSESDILVYRGGVEGILRRFPSITRKILRIMAERLYMLDGDYSELSRKFEMAQNELENTRRKLDQTLAEKEQLDKLSGLLKELGISADRFSKDKEDNVSFSARLTEAELKALTGKNFSRKGWDSRKTTK